MAITLKPHVSGDTWRGLSMTITLNGVPMNLTGAVIAMQMRALPASAQPLYTWRSDGADPQIYITDPLEGTVSIMKRIITGVGNVAFDIQVTDGLGDVRTVVSGVLPMIQDVTRV
jgi:hypothetical protein